MRWREFIKLLGVATTTWPLTARAQRGQMKSIAILLPGSADDPVFQARLTAFYQELAILGWTIGRNVRIEPRWATANASEIRRHAAELAALTPDVILATGDTTIPPLLQATRTIPIVFPITNDPVGAGFVDSLARPGWQRHRFHALRLHNWWEMARTAQRDRARKSFLSLSRLYRTETIWRSLHSLS